MADKVVVASNTDFGISSKDDRGVMPGLADMPESLGAMRSVVNRVASRLGVTLDGRLSVQDLAASVERAMRAKLQQVAAPAAPSTSPGFAP